MARTGSFTPACCKGSLALIFMTATGMLAQNAQVAPRVTATVDNAVRTTLRDNTPPQVQAADDRGALPDSTPANGMLIVLKRSGTQEMRLHQLMSDLHNPASPSYHKWLKPADFAHQFAPADQDVLAVSDWLASQGFTINQTSKGKAAIQFSGTVGQVRNAFHTELHNYVNNGVTFHANNKDPQIPSALASVVSGIASLNNIRPQNYMHLLGRASFDAKTHVTKPQWSYPADGGGVYLTLAPTDFAVQYDVDPIYKAGYTGRGETIGIVSQANVDNTVVSNYRKLFGLSNNLPSTIVDGFDPGSDGDGAGDEADLDVEVSGSVAPDAHVLLYTGYDTTVTLGLFSAAIHAVDDDTADVISMSYGICESTLGLAGNLLFSNLWSQAAAQGESVFVSTGDSGSGGCDNGLSQAESGLAVNGIASTPYNVAVGGTDFYYHNYNTGAVQAEINQYWNKTASTSPLTSLLQPIPEQPWNDAFGLNAGTSPSDQTTASASGGVSSCTEGTEDSSTGEYISCSGGYAKPSWQTGIGVPKDGARDIPDVSLFAANGDNYSFWPICAATTDCSLSNLDPQTGAEMITGIGGTSAAAPAMAGIMALIDQAHEGRQGNPNFVLYQLATQISSAFHDVTVGSNNVPCVEGSANCTLDTNGDGFYTLQKYPAGIGYDLASGLGSIDANVLLTNWGNVTYKSTATNLTVSSTSFAHGTSVTVTSTVVSSGGMPTGSVGLVNATAQAGGGLGTVALTAGTGQALLTALPGGTYNLVAEYGGDGTFAGSTSAPVSLTVTPENSLVAISGTYYGLDSNGNSLPGVPFTNGISAQYGSFFDVDVKVYGASVSSAIPGGIPTGVITVLDNGTALTTLNLNSYGLAELQTGSLGAGTHSLVFSYGGDNSFNTTSSTPYTITIVKGVAGLLIGYSVPTGVTQNSGPLVVPVEVSSPNGQLPVGGTITVTLGAQLQTLSLTQFHYSGIAGTFNSGTGTATFNVSSPGDYPLNASYSGDANLQPVSSAFNPSTVTVYQNNLPTTTTTVTPSTTSFDPDSGTLSITIKVTTTGTKIPTGLVTLSEGAFYATSYLSPLDNTGTVVVSILPSQILGNGAMQFIALYEGDHYNAPSVSKQVTVNSNVGDFSLVAGSSVLAIKAGSSGSTIVSVGTPYGVKLMGSVALQCATSSPNVTCAFANSSLTLPSDPTLVATTTLTFTAAATTAFAKPDRFFDGRLLGGSTALAMLGLCLPMRRRQRHLGRLFVLFLLVNIALLGLGGCAGSGTTPVSTTSPTTSETKAAYYTATITATSSGITHTLAVRVAVQ